MDNNEILVSENKYQDDHLSSVIDKYKKNKQDKTCHLCCLFALKCSHQFQSLNYSNIQYRNEKNSNAILSSMDIWKDNGKINNYSRQNQSPLDDIPLCFHKNYPLEIQSYPIKVCYIK